MTNRQYTLITDPVDTRDFLFAAKSTVAALPASVDLRPHMSPIVDQGALGSCTANAIASGLREYLQIVAGQPLTRLSRRWLYYREREAENSVNTDAGASLRTGFKVLAELGCAPESDCPYDIAKFAERPSAESDKDAYPFRVAEYHRVMTFADLQLALAQNQPVVIGIRVYESFEAYDVAVSGMVPLPDVTREKMLGGHAVMVVGYKTIDGVMHAIVRNSWGAGWGHDGYCYVPQSYWDAGIVMDMWTASVNAPATVDDLTFAQSIAHFVAVGAFNSPSYWTKFESDVKAGKTITRAQADNVILAFRKLATRDINLGR